MPKAMEKSLKKTASKKFPGSEERQDAYVYGTLRKTGWKPKKRGPAKTDEIIKGLM